MEELSIMTGVTDPDILTGMILGAEGIPDIMVILNSPTGCKFYHGHIAHLKRNESEISDPYLRPEPWFFGQSRIPCTYLDDQDYIFGTHDKLEKILDYMKNRWDGLIVLINAPGASLIGDDIKKVITDMGMEKRCIPVEIPGYSSSAPIGVDKMLVRILEHIKPSGKPENKINLIGLSILQRYCEGTKKEITSLLEKSGITLLSTPGAGSDTEDLSLSSGALLNAIVFPEYAIETANYYYNHFKIPFILPKDGAPIGFDATRSWIADICSFLGKEPFVVNQEIHSAEKTAASNIARINAVSGLPRGSGFAIRAESSLAFPLVKWLYTYLGMIPVGIKLTDGSCRTYSEKLINFLQENHLDNCLGIFPGKDPDIVFTDGTTGSMMKNLGICRGYIDISHPPSGKIEIIPKTIFGITGSLMLIEEILNILR